MKVTDIIAKLFKRRGIERVFVYPGGTVAPLLDSLTKEGLNIICARNEQGAGYAAIGAAKLSKKPEVVIVTSGPGATNVLTPVADAYYDSVPLFVITGQVATPYVNFEKILRQKGFQETDVVKIFEPITKEVLMLLEKESQDTIENIVTHLFYIANSGRPGPVVLDLPMDVQLSDVTIQSKKQLTCKDVSKHHLEGCIRKKVLKTIELLKKARRPIILAGNGIYISNTVEKFRDFVNKTKLPVVSSMPAVGVLDRKSDLYFGFLGHTGEFYSNLAVYYSDFILVLGSRLDIRQTGTELEHWYKKKVVRVEIDENELVGSRIKSDITFEEGLDVFFDAFLKNLDETKVVSLRNEWLSFLNKMKSKYSSEQFYTDREKLYMVDVIKAVDRYLGDKRVVVTSGVGGHQQMVARYFGFNYPDRIWLTSAGHGTMGFDVPTAIGAVISSSEYDIGVVFVGDGSFQMNIQELATIVNYNLPIKIFVLDDKRLGIVSQFQLMNWKRDPATGNKWNPSFSSIAKSYGLAGFDIYDKKDLNIIKDVLASKDPVVVHCHINSKEDVLPMLLSGQKMNEMFPFGRVEEEDVLGS